MESFRSVSGFVTGRVQGVGFRYFVLRHAQAQNICGYARNLADGRVEFQLQGDSLAVAKMLQLLSHGPAAAQVIDLEFSDDAAGMRAEGFVIR